jgi:chaperone modulatory protein CbpM
MSSKTVTGIVLDDQIELTLQEVCLACSSRTEWIVEYVEEGILQPIPAEPGEWRFPASSLVRARTAVRLQRDLGLNPAGVALALELLDEIEELKRRIRTHRPLGG